eukprot:652969-Amphidinium_carterae.1
MQILASHKSHPLEHYAVHKQAFKLATRRHYVGGNDSEVPTGYACTAVALLEASSSQYPSSVFWG